MVAKRKYVDPTRLDDCLITPNKKHPHASVVWKATIESIDVIEQGLAWMVGNGESVRIGQDPWAGCNGSYALSRGLIEHLSTKGINFLS